MHIFFKNFINYRLTFSRAGILLMLIGYLLTFVSFIKWIQILMFIPAFVLAIFMYSFFEYASIYRNIKYNVSIWKLWNVLKIFSPVHKKYNYILAYKDESWYINFLVPKPDLSYDLDTTKTYNLYLYVFWKFDIFRKRIYIWNYDFSRDIENDTYFISKKYENGDVFDKIDILKTSLNNHPYIKKEENINNYNKNKISLKIQSNNALELKWKQNIALLHILLIIVGSIWLLIEWQDFALNFLLIGSIILCLYLKKKYKFLTEKSQKIYMIVSFIFMIFLSLIYDDMSGSGSIFLIQLLLLMILSKKWSKNSFLFIFLILFVFVAISLFSSQIRFILLFLCYLFISIYLLFFISGSETFDESNYKIWNIFDRFDLWKTFFWVVFFIGIFYFLLPHWESSQNEKWSNPWNNEKTTSWFNEEIKFENVKSISTDNKKVFVIENLNESQAEKLGIKYFRWMRYDEFDGIKWESKFKNMITPFKSSLVSSNQIHLKFNYYLFGTKNIFIPSTVNNIDDKNFMSYYTPLNDTTVLKTNQNISENLFLYFTFSTDKKWKLVDTIEKTNKYNFKIKKNVEKTFQEFLKNIPKNITNSPEKLTNYIKYSAGMSYSIDDPAVDLKDFLYGKKKWHCEYFATVLAVTLQNFWFQATLVNGFANGEYNDLANSFIIRWKNAHSWVEIYDEKNKKWNIYDATPNDYNFILNTYNEYLKPITNFYDYIDIKWYVYIVNYTGEEQKKLFRYIISNRFNFLKIIWYVILTYFVFKIFWNIIWFFRLNKKEKISFFLSKLFCNNNFVLTQLRKKDTILYKKYSDFIYWNKTNIWYIEYIVDMIQYYRKK